jgi:hypothetical protein
MAEWPPVQTLLKNAHNSPRFNVQSLGAYVGSSQQPGQMVQPLGVVKRLQPGRLVRMLKTLVSFVTDAPTL